MYSNVLFKWYIASRWRKKETGKSGERERDSYSKGNSQTRYLVRRWWAAENQSMSLGFFQKLVISPNDEVARSAMASDVRLGPGSDGELTFVVKTIFFFFCYAR